MWNPREPSAWRSGRREVTSGRQPGFHILASPPGEQAPIQHINYTPSTNEVHGPGSMAPHDQLNYTLMPSEAVPSQMPGAGGGFSQGAGITGSPMGSGQGGAPVPVIPGQERIAGRYGVPGSMASGQTRPGGPPTDPSPYLAGPGPRLAATGARNAPFEARATLRGVNAGWGTPGAGQSEDDDLQQRLAQAQAAQQGGQNVNITAAPTPTPAATPTPGPAAGPAATPASDQPPMPTGYEDPAVQRNLAGEAQTPPAAPQQAAPPSSPGDQQQPPTVDSTGQVMPNDLDIRAGDRISWEDQAAGKDDRGNPLASPGGVMWINHADGTRTIGGVYTNDPIGGRKFSWMPRTATAAGTSAQNPWYATQAGPAGTALYNTESGDVKIIPNSQPVSSSVINAGSAGYMVLNQSTGALDAIPGSQTGAQITDATNAEALAEKGYGLTHPQVTSTGGGLLIPPGASASVSYNPSPLAQPDKTVTQTYKGAPLPQEARDIGEQASRLANLKGLPAAGTPIQGADQKPDVPAPAASTPDWRPTPTTDADLARHLGTANAQQIPSTPSQDPELARHLGTAGAYAPVPVLPLPGQGNLDLPPLPPQGGMGNDAAGAGQGFGDTPTGAGPAGTFLGRGITPQAGRGSSGIGWEPRLRLGAGHLGGRSSGGGGGRGGSGMSGGGGVGQDSGAQMQANMQDPGFAAALAAGAVGASPNMPAVLSPYAQAPVPLASDPEHSQPRQPMIAPQPQQQMGGGQDGAPPGPPTPAPPGGAGPTGGWQPPVPPQDVQGIGHRFGQQMDVGTPQHEGVDLQASEGISTQSPVDGMVVRVEHNPAGLGLTVVVKGNDGSEHQLGHLSHTDAYPGMQVRQGQQLGNVGSTGNTTGSHLHWGVKDQQGQPTDPTQALPPGMQNMPPVPGTQMMGPPGGTGGQAQQGAGHASAGWDPIPPSGRGAQPGAGLGRMSMGSPGVGQGDDPSKMPVYPNPDDKLNPPLEQMEYIQGGSANPITLDTFLGNPFASPEDQARIRAQGRQEIEGGIWRPVPQPPPQSNNSVAPPVQMPGHVANPGELPMPGPSINTGPGLPMGPAINVMPGPMTGGHVPGPEVEQPGVTTSSPWDPSLKEMLGYPKLQFPWDPQSGQPTGIYTETGSSGGSEQPEAPYPTQLRKHEITEQPGTGQGEAHQGLNASGQTYTINKSYAEMTPQEKDDANRYAHQMGSPSTGTSVAASPQQGDPNQTANVEDANTRASLANAQFQALLQAMVQLQQQAQSALDSMNQAGQTILQQQGQQAFADWQTHQSDRLQLLQSALSSPWLGMLSGLNPLPQQTGAPVVGGTDPWGISNILAPFDTSSWTRGSPYTPPPSQYGLAQGATAGVDPNTNLPTVTPPQGAPGTTGTPGASVPAARSPGPGQPASTAPGWDPSGQIMHDVNQPADPSSPANWAYPTGTAAGQPKPSAGAIGSNQTWAKQPQTYSDFAAMTPWQKAVYGAWYQNTYGPAQWNMEQNRLHSSAMQQGASADITPLQASSADQATLAGDVMNANVMGQSTPSWGAQQQKNWSAARAPAVKQAPGIAA